MRKMNLRVFILLMFWVSINSFLFISNVLADKLEEDHGDVLTHYYLEQDTGKIVLGLEQIVNSDYLQNDKVFRPNEFEANAYLFARVAQLNPPILQKYMDIFDKSNHRARLFMLMIFKKCGNKEVESFLRKKLEDKVFSREHNDIESLLQNGMPISVDPLKLAVTSGVDLDYLWAEFFVTGNLEAIRKIVDVLSWEDKLRTQLQIHKHNPREDFKLSQLLKSGMGTDILRDGEIVFAGDLDCLFAASLGFGHTRANWAIKVRKVLGISDEEIQYIAIKGAARWALQSNAQQHEKIFKFLRSELPLRKDKSRIEIGIILGTLIHDEKETLKLLQEINNYNL